jgi:hypothetical protein
MPIRAHMSVSIRKALMPSLAASLVLVTPETVRGQTLSARPASVALTVFVPAREPSLTTFDAMVVRRTASSIDIETMVGVAGRPASRIEVRRGTAWSPDMPRVLVQNRAGEFETLGGEHPVALLAPIATQPDARSRLTFRVEADTTTAQRVSVPVEYRITVGDGDQIAVWTVPAVLDLGVKR